MTPDRRRRIDELYQAALTRQAQDRVAFLNRACASDEDLRREVESLLYENATREGFLDEPAAGAAHVDFGVEGAMLTDTQHIGNYRLLSLLGAGGMGEVYLAEDTRLRRKVAIKVLPARSLADEHAKARLLREARAAAALDHANICTVYEIGEAQGVSFIVMQYIEGETLAARLIREPLDARDALAVATQVAAALTEAHHHGIVHRDIKPQNVMLSSRGQVKVLDFGIARGTSLADAAPASQATATGVILGTLPYMSPEQLRGEELDGRSDIFSFGILLHEMLAGESPFAAPSSAGTIAAILTAPPRPLERGRGADLHELAQIVTKCLEKDRDQRYQTALDLVIDLESAARRIAGQEQPKNQVPAAAPRVALSGPTGRPIPQTQLVGRDYERMASRALLLRPDVRLVTFTGAGGTGKTRLALQIAADVEQEFAGGVVFVALATIADPTLVVQTVAHVFGVRESGSRDLTEALKKAIATSRRPVLLLLDNFEQVLDAAPLVSDLLASCANLKVLVTSRAVLRLTGEHDFEVHPLAVPTRSKHLAVAELARSPAISLFIQRAAAVKPDFVLTSENAVAVAEICTRLDGLPLAIELAAARVRMLTPSAMLQRLENRFELLTGGARDLPARQQTLRATMEWSHGLLKPEEQTLFRRMAVFVNGCTLEAVEAVCDSQDTLHVDILDAVESLVGQSLVQQVQQPDGEPRFTMLETVREYGLQRLAVSPDEAATRRAHAAYCLVLAEEGTSELAPDDFARWLARCDVELDNFRAALEWAALERELEWGLRLGAALHSFWYSRGRHKEGSERLGLLLRLSGHVTPRTRVRALNALGNLAWDQGDVASGVKAYEECLAISRDLGNVTGIVLALNALAYAAQQRREDERARSLFQECVDLLREGGDHRGMARALVNLGQCVLNSLDDPGAAQPLFEQALVTAERLNDLSIVAMCWNQLGDVARARDDAQTARIMYERAITTYGGHADRWTQALTLVDLGTLLSDQGDHQAGHLRLVQALSLAREMGHRPGIAKALRALAHCALRRGHAERALRLTGAAQAVRESIGSGQFNNRDEIALARDLDAARQAFGAAASEAEKAGRRMSLEDAIEYAIGEDGER